MTIAIPDMPMPTQAALAALVAYVGNNLPTDYLEFVSKHDGAEPETNSLKVGQGNEIGISRFIPVVEAPSVSAEVEGFPDRVIPLAEDDSGNFVFIEDATGHIYFWDHELDDGGRRIASSLNALLVTLIPFDASSVKLAPGQVKYAWIDPSFKPEF